MNNERGMALPLVLMIMLVLGLLGGALLQYSGADVKSVAREEKRLQAHYLARSGAVAVVAELDQLVGSLIWADGEFEKQLVSDPVEMGAGNFTVVVMVKRKHDESEIEVEEVRIRSTGTIHDGTRFIKDKVELVLLTKVPGELPPADAIEEVFPEEFDFNDGWTSGTDSVADGGPGWVSNNGKVVGDGVFTDDDGNYVSVRFENGIQVDHITGQQVFNWYTTYMLFENTPISLYVSQGNTIRLHADVIVFLGEVRLQQSGGNYGTLSLHTINGEQYGKVYFYQGVTYAQNKNPGTSSTVFVPAGAYYFWNGVVIDGRSPNGRINPPMSDPPVTGNGLIPLGGDSQTWH